MLSGFAPLQSTGRAGNCSSRPCLPHFFSAFLCSSSFWNADAAAKVLAKVSRVRNTVLVQDALESFAFPQSAHVASLAQLAEHALRKRMVVGLIPTGGFYLCRCVVTDALNEQGGVLLRTADTKHM